MQLAFARLGPLFPDFFAARAYQLWFTAHRFRSPDAELAAAVNAEHASININNVDIKIWSWGQGVPVLFIHGWSGRGTQVLHFLEPLLQAGYRVISFDGPAHGQTAGKQTNILEFTDVVLALGEKYGPFDATITHSFGGMILAYAMTRGFSTRRAVRISSPASFDTLIEHFKLALCIPDSVIAAVLSRLHADFGADLGHRISTLENVRLNPATALIVHDDSDSDVPWRDGMSIAENWPGAQFMLTHNLGHRRILRDRDIIAAAVAFIRNNQPG